MVSPKAEARHLGAAELSGLETGAIVLDRDPQCRGALRDGQRGPGGVGVLPDIGERFLGDAQPLLRHREVVEPQVQMGVVDGGEELAVAVLQAVLDPFDDVEQGGEEAGAAGEHGRG
jgi:hypothetical protein